MPDYYFYYYDKDFGLIHLRVPTWLPMRLLARQVPQADCVIDAGTGEGSIVRGK